jgi:hypothetical protein
MISTYSNNASDSYKFSASSSSTYWFRNAIQTPDGTILDCLNNHDYHWHLDKVSGEHYMNDGLGWCVRRSINAVEALDLSVTTADSFEKIRTALKWKSYGKNGEHPEGIYITLCNIEDDHLNAILRTQSHIRGTPVYESLIMEKVYRFRTRYNENYNKEGHTN